MAQLLTLSRIKLSTFGQAQAKGFRVKWVNLLRGRSNDLIPFQEVQRALRLYNKKQSDLQTVEIDQIVGSVGRTQDFSREFYPRNRALEARWERVNQLFYRTGLTPVELYKVSNVYFVLDGHHRVSVYRSYGVNFIEAYVTEFYSPISINNSDDLNSIGSKLRQSRKTAPRLVLS